jgi:hypothetical protein
MYELIPAIVSILFLVTLAAGFLLRDRTRRLERRRALLRMGFHPSPEQTEQLVDIVTAVEHNASYRYSVDHPMWSSVGDKVCYVYTKLRMQRTRVDAAEEVLVSLTRPSKEGLLLLVGSSALPLRSIAQWAETLHPGVPHWYPRDLSVLEMAPGMDSGSIIGAFGPPGAALMDLIDMQTFDRIKALGERGVSTITCRGDWCSFSAASARTVLDVKELISLLRELSL